MMNKITSAVLDVIKVGLHGQCLRALIAGGMCLLASWTYSECAIKHVRNTSPLCWGGVELALGPNKSGRNSGASEAGHW